jgi:hypothetical protein
MNSNERVPIFTELINAECAVISGGEMPIFYYDGKIAKILNADGHGKVVTLLPAPPASPSSPKPADNLVNLLGL